MDEQALNKKLAERRFPPSEDFRVSEVRPDFIIIERRFTQEAEDRVLSQDPSLKGVFKVGEWYKYESIPILTGSLDACEKWLMPKLHKLKFHILIDVSWNSNPSVEIYNDSGLSFSYSGTTPKVSIALAFCLAIEKLIDGEKK